MYASIIQPRRALNLEISKVLDLDRRGATSPHYRCHFLLETFADGTVSTEDMVEGHQFAAAAEPLTELGKVVCASLHEVINKTFRAR